MFARSLLVNFFAEKAGINQHFRIMHRNTAMNVDLVRYKTPFMVSHGKETASVIKWLCRLRLQMVQ